MDIVKRKLILVSVGTIGLIGKQKWREMTLRWVETATASEKSGVHTIVKYQQRHAAGL